MSGVRDKPCRPMDRKTYRYIYFDDAQLYVIDDIC